VAVGVRAGDHAASGSIWKYQLLDPSAHGLWLIVDNPDGNVFALTIPSGRFNSGTKTTHKDPAGRLVECPRPRAALLTAPSRRKYGTLVPRSQMVRDKLQSSPGCWSQPSFPPQQDQAAAQQVFDPTVCARRVLAPPQRGSGPYGPVSVKPGTVTLQNGWLIARIVSFILPESFLWADSHHCPSVRDMYASTRYAIHLARTAKVD
jgi:hypothetical protein